MGTRAYKPTTSGRRWQTGFTFDEITAVKPVKSLTEPIKSTAGRGSSGRVTSRWRGGGHKRRYRLIDFKRKRDATPATVMTIEYDPVRSARIALLKYEDGELAYIICPDGLKIGSVLKSGPGSEIEIGNNLPLAEIPPGTPIHGVEMVPGKGAQIARSAGNSCVIMAREGEYAHLRMPSGEVRLLNLKCRATVGQVGNAEHEQISVGKAGRSRWLGRMPRVRGVAMNPVDHPMGGGEGKSSGGRHPCSPQGLLAKGFRTRNKRKVSNRFILRRRK